VAFILRYKWHLIITLLLSLVLAIQLFPSGDLRDLVSEQISQHTGAYATFEELELNLLPQPGFRAENIHVEPQGQPSLTAGSAEAGFSIVSLLLGRIAAKVTLSELFKGSLEVDFSEGEKLKSGHRIQNLGLSASGLNIDSLTDYLRSGNLVPVALTGVLDLNTELKIDPNFETQPSGSLGAEVKAMTLPSQTLQIPFQLGNETQYMPVALPGLALGKVTMQARMSDGQIEIQELNFGGSGEGVAGKIRGKLGLSIRKIRMGNQEMIQPQISTYQLNVDLVLQKRFYDAQMSTPLGLILNQDMIRTHEQLKGEEYHYSFSLSPGPNGLPAVTAQRN
jgi:type II secretion system protein N